MTNPTRTEDERLLLMLDLRYNAGMKGKRLQAAVDMTTGAVAGACQRVQLAHAPDDCKLAENRTGGMPRGWWRS